MTKELLTLSALLAAMHAQAQDSTAKKALDEVVITATKYPKKTSETGKVISVITREQLDRSGGKDLAQLLNEQTGLSVNGANSNPGKDKSIFLRGAKSDYTLIMIDGAPVYDATGSSSNFDFRLLPVENIERIEILKGSQSTLYGSDAVAGVIHIITRQGDARKTIAPFASAAYGSYNTRRLNAGINGGSGFFSYNAGFTHYKTDGISESADKNNTGTFDKDGYEQNAFMANLGFKVNNAAKIMPFLRYAKYYGKLDADAFSDDKDYTYNMSNMQTGVRNELTLGKVKLHLNYNFTATKRNYLNDSLVKSSPFDGYSKGFYEGKEHFLDAYLHVPVLPTLSFTGGIDYRNGITDVKTSGVYKYEMGGVIYSGEYASTIGSDSATQNQTGVYGAFTYAAKGLNIEAGGRFNHHSVYGNNAVFNVNPSYLINRQFKIFANISTAYKVPTLYQMHSEYKNPFTGLQPEKAITYEAGVQYYSANNLVNVRGAIFRRDVKEGIAFYTDPNTFRSYFINQDKQNDWGFEIEPVFNIRDKGQLLLSYAFVDGEVTTRKGEKDTSYFNLIRRPKSIFNATANYHITKKLFISLGVQRFGKRSDLDFSAAPAAIVSLKAYTLLNAYVEYRFLNDKLRVFADAKNLTDTDYTEVYGYNAQGMNLQGGFRLSL
ncbi:TonB-dependent receptor plug domain-containing protein [Chitinophaga rhizosphaerae]|uniref:TonB-dependent receptor plug domain-containing protein n=1 Tax=Chitinophaga rhizosphaerae TaxID=1864947 RepID=UPI0013E0A761|nr:TonB-dependent receptor [Chitinophaga rhizosphaerae]